MKFVFAQISDTHFGGSPTALDKASRIMDHLRGLPLDALLVTGDIADNATAEEYDVARKVLASDIPTIFCPGNHDDRRTMRAALLDEEESDEPINQVLRWDGLTIALADSLIPPRQNPGRLSEETLAWLESVIAPDVPAIIGMHHPPVSLGLPKVDPIGLQNAADLEDLVRRHPQVVAVLAGHAHTAASTMFAGVPLLVAPGTVSTSMLPVEPSDHPWDVNYELPPAVSLHVWDGERLTTHIRSVH